MTRDSSSAEREDRRPRQLQDVVFVTGHRRSSLVSDLYARFLRTTWSRVLLFFASGWIAVNAAFAVAYLGCGDCIEGARRGSFVDAFFFSVHTIGTIGYGTMSPRGMAGNVLVAAEAFVGMMLIAIATGLIFSKFARPTARVLFSRNALVTVSDGRPTLMFRMANERGNNVVEAIVRAAVLKDETTSEGQRFRRVVDLKLVRASTPVFALSWTAMHVIDETSPLFGLTAEDLVRGDVRLIVTLTGLDATFAQQIHATHFYWPDQILFGRRFVDVMTIHPDGRTELDLRRFHDVT